MPATKKSTSSKKLSKKAVIVTETKVAKSVAFAGKIKKVNKLLDNTKWLDS